MARNDVWTREQTIVAFYYYCNIPFGQFSQNNPKVIEIARVIGRKPSAVVFKIGNLASLDPEMKRRGVGGLPNSSKMDKQVWEEFNEDWNKLSLEAAQLIADFKNEPLEVAINIDLNDLPKGEDKLRVVKTRVYQNFFRNSVLAAYENVCCITGIIMPDLHIASHIKPWRIDEKNRTNPQNGLCLNALHDRAFDKGLITILPDFTIRVSRHLEEIESKEAIEKYFLSYNMKTVIRPHKFLPLPDFLEYHNDVIFRK